MNKVAQIDAGVLNVLLSEDSGTCSHRTIEGGIAHNLPQEAPEAFADAVLEVGGAR